MTRPLGPVLAAELWHRLYTAIVTDALNEYFYDAELAGLAYSFEASSLGLCVSISGYNDKLHVLLRDILARAKDVEVRADRLDVIIEEVIGLSSDIQLIGFDILYPLHRPNEPGRTFFLVNLINYRITTDIT